MTVLALGFLVASWSGVLGLTGWCFYRVLRADEWRSGSDDGSDDREAT